MPQQYEINTIRVSYQDLASVLGGVQSMFTCAMDEPFSIPTEETARLSLRVQQVLGFETGVADTSDPLGGSYFIESLTKEMEDKIEELIEKVEARGGMIRSIKDGFVQKEILEEAYKKAKVLLEQNLDKLKTLSSNLLEKEVMSGDEVKSLLGIEKSDLA